MLVACVVALARKVGAERPRFAVLVVGFAVLVARVGENEAESGERGSVPAGEVPFAIAARGNPGAAKAT